MTFDITLLNNAQHVRTVFFDSGLKIFSAEKSHLCLFKTLVRHEFIQVWCSCFIEFNRMEYLVFDLCLLFAKSTFESYKLLTKLSQTIKLILKNTPNFLEMRKTST